MLLVDSTKRMSVDQIVAHRWMHPQGEEEEEQQQFRDLLQEYNTRPPPSPGVSTDTDDTEDPLYEQVLDYMTHLGLDRQRTAEVCGVLFSVCTCLWVLVCGTRIMIIVFF